MKLTLNILCTLLCSILCCGLVLTMKIDIPKDILADIVKLTLILINVWAMCELWGWHLLCNIFGHSISSQPINGIIYCRRCKMPLYRINKNN